MYRNLLRECRIKNIQVYTVVMPARIKSYVVRKDDWYTICINECLCYKKKLEACGHEVDHINRGDFDSSDPTGLLEIRAHRRDRE